MARRKQLVAIALTRSEWRQIHEILTEDNTNFAENRATIDVDDDPLLFESMALTQQILSKIDQILKK